jgi:hypothetical protein
MALLTKTQRIANELSQLPIHNPKLRMILDLAWQYVWIEFKKDLTVTELFRTPEENHALYLETIKNGGKEPDWRPHTQWMAFDLRSSNLIPSEISKLLSFLNLITVFSGQRKCAVYHTIQGNVAHFHVQSDKG